MELMDLLEIDIQLLEDELMWEVFQNDMQEILLDLIFREQEVIVLCFGF